MTTPRYQDVMGTWPMYFIAFIGVSMSLITFTLMTIAASTAATAVFGVVALLITGAVLTFSRLYLDIDQNGVRVSFSRIATRTYAYADIARIEPEPYDWKEFVGWGVRWNNSGNMTYSLVGIQRCLRLHMHDGSQFVVSCTRPKDAIAVAQHYMGAPNDDAPPL